MHVDSMVVRPSRDSPLGDALLIRTLLEHKTIWEEEIRYLPTGTGLGGRTVASERVGTWKNGVWVQVQLKHHRELVASSP